jgi:hypothetical protein
MSTDSDEVDDATFLANVQADEDDEAFFLAWLAAYGHTCSHAEWTKAKAETEHLLRRPRLLRAEFWHAWLRVVVRDEMKLGGKDAAVVATRDHFKLSSKQERTIWTAAKLITKPGQAEPAMTTPPLFKHNSLQSDLLDAD